MAIIGNGDLAGVLTDRDDVTYFASGVSNSGEGRWSEFQREIDLLMTMPTHRHLIYFSTLSMYYCGSPYARFKSLIEDVVRKNFESYTIFRIGNITWGKNPNTFINYLKAHPEAEIKPVWRHIIDKEDFLYWVGLAPIGQKHEMNITGKRIWLPEWRAAQPW